MTDRPILFSGPMVRAILEGRKTQTRRVINHRWSVLGGSFPKKLWSGLDLGRAWSRGNYLDVPWSHPDDGDVHEVPIEEACIYRVSPPYAPGDRLWVREAWRASSAHDDLSPQEIPQGDTVEYASDGKWKRVNGKSRPSMFMPRWASRITLLVTDVRVQRLQDISAADTIAEGVQCETCEAMGKSNIGGKGCFASIKEFVTVWDRINGKRPGCAWSDNPWVAAYTFKPVLKNIGMAQT